MADYHGTTGNDYINVGAGLSVADKIDGGAGSDTLYLNGDYSTGLVLRPETIQNIEWIQFWEGHDYALTTNDKNVGAGAQLVVDADSLRADDWVSFDGSAETDGYFSFSIGSASSTLIGGAGDDDFTAQDVLSTFDVIDGGAGDDLLKLYGYRQAVFDFAGNHLRNIEHIVISGDASLTLTDDVLAAGQTLRIETTQGAISFDGSAERDGTYLLTGGDVADHLQGGRGADTIAGLGGDDRIVGHGGADDLRGGDGADTFVYRDIRDSAHKAFDIIHDLGEGDVIDLSAIDAKTGKDGNQAFHLVTKLTGHAGEAALHYDPVSGRTELGLDVDGDGRADATILIDGDHRDFANFVL